MSLLLLSWYLPVSLVAGLYICSWLTVLTAFHLMVSFAHFSYLAGAHVGGREPVMHR